MSKSTVLRFVVTLILLALMLGGFTAQAVIQPAKNVFASGPSGVAWPVRGSVGTWTVEDGYNIVNNQGADHGPPVNFAQLFGMDLILNSSQSDAAHKDVVSPVDGDIKYASLGSKGYSI